MKGRWIQYSEQELQWLSDNRQLTISEYHSQFVELFSRPDIEAKNLHALRKRKGWKTGRTGRFEKGNVPHPDAKPKGPNKTSFKKGAMPHNWKTVGSTRVNVDGYVEVKIQEPRTWVQLHTIIWSAAHGDIPEGHCVVFVDGDKTNIKLSNLELISRSEHLQINKLTGKFKAEEVREIVRSIGKMNAKIYELKDNKAKKEASA